MPLIPTRLFSSQKRRSTRSGSLRREQPARQRDEAATDQAPAAEAVGSTGVPVRASGAARAAGRLSGGPLKAREPTCPLCQQKASQGV